MYTAADFRQAYSDYIDFCRDLESKVSPLGGVLKVLGFNRGPATDPGHEKFFKEMEAALKEVCSENPDPDTAASILDVIFLARYTYADEPVSPLMFIAVEGASIDLISFIRQEKAAELYQQYKADNPRNLQVPAQRKTMAALKKAAGK